jgi:hypothetical protein
MDNSNESNQKPAARRRRGGQPGNHNALKHGLYTQEVWAEVKPRKAAGDAADGLEAASLLAEVAMLRSLIHRLFESAWGEDSTSGLIEVLRALGVASTRLAVLLRTQRLLEGGQGSQAIQVIQEALTEVMAEMKLAATRLDSLAETPETPGEEKLTG